MTPAPDPAAFYADQATRLKTAWATLSAEQMLSPVARHLPTSPARVLDIGAGTGTLASWLAARGHDVTATEPVAAFHGALGPVWSTARLPKLTGITGPYDLALVVGVWHHVPPAERRQSMARISGLLRPESRLIMALRHGPLPDDRPAWPNPTEQVVDLAHDVWLATLDTVETNAQQPQNRAAGVTFTWLVFQNTA